jgi:hypothetical protein
MTQKTGTFEKPNKKILLTEIEPLQLDRSTDP